MNSKQISLLQKTRVHFQERVKLINPFESPPFRKPFKKSHQKKKNDDDDGDDDEGHLSRAPTVGKERAANMKVTSPRCNVGRANPYISARTRPLHL